MHYTTKLVSIAGGCLMATLSACTANFDALNTDQHNPPGSLLSTSEQSGTYIGPMINIVHLSQQNRCQHTEQMIGQYGGQVATSAAWSGVNFANFNPRPDWEGIAWTDNFAQFYAEYLPLKRVTKGEGWIYHWGNIIRVATQHRVADIFGPIPYS